MQLKNKFYKVFNNIISKDDQKKFVEELYNVEFPWYEPISRTSNPLFFNFSLDKKYSKCIIFLENQSFVIIFCSINSLCFINFEEYFLLSKN